MNDSPHPTGGSVTRRAVLAGAATVAVAGLAGCSGGEAETLPTPILGDRDGRVVEVFSDFSCPHCRTFHLEQLPRLEAGVLAEGGVRLEHHDFPIPVNDWSWRAAVAARAVQSLGGNEAFWAFSGALYEHLGDYSLDLVARLADDVGVDGAAVRAAVEDEQYRDVVAADRDYGQERGVPGTPAVVVNDRFVSPTAAAIETAVRQ